MRAPPTFGAWPRAAARTWAGKWLTRFETHRARLRGVAFRMLGSVTEADDAVQEAWLRLTRTGPGGVRNLGGWLTTVVSRVCLDLLRARASAGRTWLPAPAGGPPGGLPDGDPAAESELVDDVGRALLVVLDRLAPAERVAFVLHDMFAVPFGEIAPVLDRSPAATRSWPAGPGPGPRYAHGGRRRPGAAPPGGRGVPGRVPVRRRRRGHRGAGPGRVRRADRAALPGGLPLRARGAGTVAGEIVVFGGQARFAAPALVNGDAGIVVAPHGSCGWCSWSPWPGTRSPATSWWPGPARLAQLEVATLGK